MKTSSLGFCLNTPIYRDETQLNVFFTSFTPSIRRVFRSPRGFLPDYRKNLAQPLLGHEVIERHERIEGGKWAWRYIKLSFIAILLACSSKAPKPEDSPPQTAPEMNTRAAHELEADYFTDVKFKKSATTLSPQARTQIAKLLQKADASGKIREVVVFAWPDQEYPSEDQAKLSQKDISLAFSRSQYVAKNRSRTQARQR